MNWRHQEACLPFVKQLRLFPSDTQEPSGIEDTASSTGAAGVAEKIPRVFSSVIADHDAHYFNLMNGRDWDDEGDVGYYDASAADSKLQQQPNESLVNKIKDILDRKLIGDVFVIIVFVAASAAARSYQCQCSR